MSIAGLIDPEMSTSHKKSFHRRNDSGELDVFEAARYFSGYHEVIGSTNFTQKMIMREERHFNNNSNSNSNIGGGGQHRGRISLDMPMRSLLPQQFHSVEKQIMKEKKLQKQPSSPGGRLASFLNSLFSQSASKKKKSKSTTQSMKDHEDESPGGGRRRRRSSISHFRSSSTTDSSSSVSSKSLYYSSSLSSGFRTPPYVVQTPTKKEFRTLSDHKQALSSFSSKCNNIGQVRSTTTLESEIWDDKKKRETSLLDGGYKRNNELVEKDHRNMIWMEKNSEEEEKGIRKFNEADEGAESDSSSDLFELQNYDLGYYSSGLPVYETTNMDNIKRGTPISNASL